MRKITIALFCVFVSAKATAQKEGNLRPCGSEDLYGYCDENGKQIIEPRFQKAYPFNGELAAVEHEGSIWMINRSGKLKFNTRLYPDSDLPALEKGLFKVTYFDPIFANVTEHYNRRGQPVKVLPGLDHEADTLFYSMFNAKLAIEWAKTKLGTPYGTDGLDCSGFIRFVFNGYGIVLPYFAKEMAQRGEEVAIEKAKPGDLIFFAGSNAAEKAVNHVGLIMSRLGNSVEFIHASSSKGVTINKSTDAYFKPRFLSVRRIFE